MAATTIPCTGCDVRLKMPEGKTKVRCPRCGTVVAAPEGGARVSDPGVPRQPSLAKGGKQVKDDPFEEERLEIVDELEEVDEKRTRSARNRAWEEADDRPRLKRKQRRESSEGPWMIAVGVDLVFALITFVMTMISYWSTGLPDNKGQGGYPVKLLCLFAALCIGVVIAGMGLLCVKEKTIYDRWGFATTGPIAIIAGFIVTLCGAGLMGFAGAGCLLSVILGH
jgi:LSD1 subclass zinc finger protein